MNKESLLQYIESILNNSVDYYVKQDWIYGAIGLAYFADFITFDEREELLEKYRILKVS